MQRLYSLPQDPGQGNGIIMQHQGFDFVAQIRIVQIEIENKILQNGRIEISQFCFECIDIQRSKWKVIFLQSAIPTQ